jgi:hypothetical protein
MSKCSSIAHAVLPYPCCCAFPLDTDMYTGMDADVDTDTDMNMVPDAGYGHGYRNFFANIYCRVTTYVETFYSNLEISRTFDAS